MGVVGDVGAAEGALVTAVVVVVFDQREKSSAMALYAEGLTIVECSGELKLRPKNSKRISNEVRLMRWAFRCKVAERIS